MSVSTAAEVIADTTRRSILDELLGGEKSVSTLVERLGISQPAVSKHLKVLREAELVAVRPDGQRRLYSVRPDGLVELDAWLEPYRQMWRDSLNRLEAQLSQARPVSRRKQP